MMPIIVSGMAIMIITGMTQRAGLRDQQDADQQERRPKAMPRSRKTSTVIFHSPSPAQIDAVARRQRLPRHRLLHVEHRVDRAASGHLGGD